MEYLTNDTELTLVADAIRNLGGTSSPLSYPFGWINALSSIETWPYGECGDIQGSIVSSTGLGSRKTLNATFQANQSITFVSFPEVSSVTSSRAFRGCTNLRGANFRILSSIPRLMFATCSQLQAVSFPECETIDYGAFFYCVSLRMAYFPSCTTIMSASSSIGFVISSNSYFPTSYVSASYAGAFERAGIREANFPLCTSIGGASTGMGGFAFGYCSSLVSISFPVCSYIGSRAFLGCSALKSAYFPACTHLDVYAFDDCSALTSVNFPACLSIGKTAFYECSALTSAYFPACEVIDDAAFRQCSALSSVTFLNCTSIGNRCFSECTALAFVSLPACTHIGSAAFMLCSSLVSLYLFGASIAALSSSNAFFATPMSDSTYTGTYGSIYVPASLLTSYQTATNWTYFSDRFVGLTDEEIAAL